MAARPRTIRVDARALLVGAAPEEAKVGPIARGLGPLLRRFGVPIDHVGMLALGALLLALIQADDVLFSNVAETLFVKRVGPEWLPPVYVARGLFLVVTLYYVGVALDRRRRIETIRLLIVVAAVAPFLLWLALLTESVPAFVLTLLASEVVSFPIVAALWALFLEIVPGGATRRVGGLLIACGLIGEAGGSALSASMAHLVGVENTLLAAIALPAAAGLVLSRIAASSLVRLDVGRPPKLPAPGPRAAFRRSREQTAEAFALGRRSALFRFLVATTAVAAAIAPFVDLQFQIAAASAFHAELDLISFYAILKALLSVAALALQLLAFGWLRREAGVARTLLVLPLAGAAALAVLLGSGGIAAVALVWALLRLGGAAVDEPARRFLFDLFPVELRERVDWLANRSGRNFATACGSLLLIPIFYLGGPVAVTTTIALLIGVWLIVAALFRARYGQLVLATSLMNRVDFDQLRPDDVSQFLDRAAVRQLERELVSGVAARAQLAIELLQQIGDARLPAILASGYVRQPPVLRSLFLSTIQRELRVARPGSPAAAAAIIAVARLIRSRLPDRERAALIRIYSQAIVDLDDDRKDASDLLTHLDHGGALPVELALAAARHRLAPDQATDRALADALDRSFAASDEQDVHLAIAETEELFRADPIGNAGLLLRFLDMLDDRERWSPRVRAHVVGSATRLAALAEAFPCGDFDERIAPLALHHDPRLAAGALDYMRHARFLPLLETHVLPNLTAGNHHVRERARQAVEHFGVTAVPALLELVRSGTRRERLAASRLLGSYPVGRAAHRELIRQEVEELEVQLVNVDLLTAQGDDGGADPRFRLLAGRLEEEAVEHVRAVLRLLYADTGDELLLRIERQLFSQDRALRVAALEALADRVRGVPGGSHMPRLIDERPIAERAVEARARVPDPPGSIDELLRRCAADPNWVTRLIACHTIGDAGRTALRDVLVGFAGDYRAALRTEAEAALARLDGPNAAKDGAMTIVERMLLLKETEIFRNLEARDLAGIAGVVKEAEFAPGTPVMREGDRGDFLAIIASGKVSVVKNDGQGGTFVIRSMGRPEAVGEIALLEEGPRSASIIADEQSKALLLWRAEFEALIEEYPGVALGIARVLSRRLATITAQVAANRR